MKELRIPYKNGYLIWNKGLMFGEETPNEDLWNAGYRFGVKKIFGIKFIYACKNNSEPYKHKIDRETPKQFAAKHYADSLANCGRPDIIQKAKKDSI